MKNSQAMSVEERFAKLVDEALVLVGKRAGLGGVARAPLPARLGAAC